MQVLHESWHLLIIPRLSKLRVHDINTSFHIFHTLLFINMINFHFLFILVHFFSFILHELLNILLKDHLLRDFISCTHETRSNKVLNEISCTDFFSIFEVAQLFSDFLKLYNCEIGFHFENMFKFLINYSINQPLIPFIKVLRENISIERSFFGLSAHNNRSQTGISMSSQFSVNSFHGVSRLLTLNNKI